MFDEVYEFGAGETITQSYRQGSANGNWDAIQVKVMRGRRLDSSLLGFWRTHTRETVTSEGAM